MSPLPLPASWRRGGPSPPWPFGSGPSGRGQANSARAVSHHNDAPVKNGRGWLPPSSSVRRLGTPLAGFGGEQPGRRHESYVSDGQEEPLAQREDVPQPGQQRGDGQDQPDEYRAGQPVEQARCACNG